jgi:hypothetical protein
MIEISEKAEIFEGFGEEFSLWRRRRNSEKS